jgi:bifunctional non-homologous end joining protein LigD
MPLPYRKPLRAVSRSRDSAIETCQPVLSDVVPAGPDWFHELKHDGWRMIARKSGRRVRLWSRQAYDWTEAFPAIVAALQHLPHDEFVLDGEAVAHDENGMPEFWALKSPEKTRSAILYAFDLLTLGGKDLRPSPLAYRRDLLEEVAADPLDGLRISERYEGDGGVLFRHACALNLEGIVSKRKDTPYRSGRFDGWRKIKCPDYRRRE